VVGAVRALFHDDAMTPVLAKLRDYCFQQGGLVSNANPRDQQVFEGCLTHDLVFFKGDQGRPIVDDLPIDPKAYNALPQMKASFVDLFKVTKRNVLGGMVGESRLTQRGAFKAGVSPLGGPRRGAWVLGRVVQVGRGLMLSDPYLTLDEGMAAEVTARFEEEYEETRAKHEGLTRTSLLKVAGYHVYEEAASRVLEAHWAKMLPEGMRLEPLLIEFKVRHRRQLPDLRALGRVRVVDETAEGKATLVMMDTLRGHGGTLPRSLREAMISVEGDTVTVIGYVLPALEDVLGRVREALPKKVHERIQPLTRAGRYRALRHTWTESR